MDTTHNFRNDSIFPTQLELFSLNYPITETDNKLLLSSANKQSMLGQVFTPTQLADFMVSLINSKINQSHRVLDPCIGPNTFLPIICNFTKPKQVTGLEIDESLILDDIKNFFAQNERRLIVDSFFNLPLSEKFDFIIENPPYVRQELLTEGGNSKSLILRSLPSILGSIPSKSNLYVYFLLKSIFHLNECGRLIAVIYDSWLYSDFGRFLKKAFINFGSIEAIYHFKKNAFPNVEVGATVIDFKRIINLDKKNKIIKIYSLKTVDEVSSIEMNTELPYTEIQEQEFSSFRFNEDTVLDFNNDLFKPIEKISNQSIQRGISSIANQYFIQREKQFEESITFIKDVTTIRSFSVKNELFYLLALKNPISNKARTYLDYVKKEILSNPEKFKALKERITKNEVWYKVRLKKTGNIIFNYYLRKNIDFLLNEDLHYASDNFYILNVDENLFANFAILNSSFTKISLLLHSRSQGNGLRKIQLYEFKKVPIIDISKLSNCSIKQLKLAGQKLKSVDRFSEEKETMINEIDEILVKEYNSFSKIQITTTQLYKDIQNIFSIN